MPALLSILSLSDSFLFHFLRELKKAVARKMLHHGDGSSEDNSYEKMHFCGAAALWKLISWQIESSSWGCKSNVLFSPVLYMLCLRNNKQEAHPHNSFHIFMKKTIRKVKHTSPESSITSDFSAVTTELLQCISFIILSILTDSLTFKPHWSPAYKHFIGDSDINLCKWLQMRQSL